jgi:hypothetical protein
MLLQNCLVHICKNSGQFSSVSLPSNQFGSVLFLSVPFCSVPFPGTIDNSETSEENGTIDNSETSEENGTIESRHRNRNAASIQ